MEQRPSPEAVTAQSQSVVLSRNAGCNCMLLCQDCSMVPFAVAVGVWLV
jgi:hypothetical protein